MKSACKTVVEKLSRWMVSGVACAILGLTCARLYALCESCSLALAGLQVEQYFAVEALNYSTSAIEQLNADIGPLMSSLDSLDQQIGSAQDDATRDGYQAERDRVAAEVSPMIQERNRLESGLDSLNLTIAAAGGLIASYGDVCEHDTNCEQCGNLLEQCSCQTCSTCNNPLGNCSCNQISYCPTCGFDDRYCGCSNPFENS
jgi:outer membrane murein-binding lipoprotein Lpp